MMPYGKAVTEVAKHNTWGWVVFGVVAATTIGVTVAVVVFANKLPHL